MAVAFFAPPILYERPSFSAAVLDLQRRSFLLFGRRFCVGRAQIVDGGSGGAHAGDSGKMTPQLLTEIPGPKSRALAEELRRHESRNASTVAAGVLVFSLVISPAKLANGGWMTKRRPGDGSITSS